MKVSSSPSFSLSLSSSSKSTACTLFLCPRDRQAVHFLPAVLKRCEAPCPRPHYGQRLQTPPRFPLHDSECWHGLAINPLPSLHCSSDSHYTTGLGAALSGPALSRDYVLPIVTTSGHWWPTARNSALETHCSLTWSHFFEFEAMIPSCQMRQAMVRFAWILAAVSPVSAG